MGEHIPLQRNSAKACRICFDTDNPNDLISPCLCKGGSAYVHRKCLDDWRSVNKNGRAFKFCDVCQFEYVIEPVVDNPSIPWFDWFFCCGWMNDNHNTNRSNDTCPNCACYPYNCICLDCHGCDGPNNCGGDGGNGGGAAVVVIVIILIFAAIGIVVGVILTAMIVSEIMKRHTNKLWLRQEAKKYVVTDFQGRMHELENMPAQRRIKASTIHVQK
ncbi:unnamed protein product [Rotaria magnacalcarata]|uniref:RING-CH-type domain-containing protein n=1 Tax=Rotaria magnacalcarata TaxID=392030 RepID=A0A820EHQ9_9BILA|nr:unnamed protein product [Rotaria magnacalcarata]